MVLAARRSATWLAQRDRSEVSRSTRPTGWSHLAKFSLLLRRRSA